VLRPLTRKRTAPPYDALRGRAQAVRRADRLGSRTRPRTVAVPAASRSRPRPFRTDPKDVGAHIRGVSRSGWNGTAALPRRPGGVPEYIPPSLAVRKTVIAGVFPELTGP
jgi:hypothetical protein